MDSVENLILEKLNYVPNQAAASSDTVWTQKVKEAIVAAGKESGFQTAGHSCGSSYGNEWLYDVVWYQADTTDGDYFTDIILAAESEWGNLNNIKTDFEKLMVARCNYRVMVFQAATTDEMKQRFNKMQEWVQHFKKSSAGDRYLLICWDNEKKNISCSHYIYR